MKNKKIKAWLTMIIMIVLLTACGSKIPDPLNWKLDDFTYTNQENRSFGLSDLQGKVWIADFIFTNCETVCPPMTANMAKLQKKMKAEGLEVEFVSFSVDPEHDTPEALSEYIKQYDADLTNWNLLTGYKQEEIEQFALKQFKTIVQMPKESDQVIHGTDFYLIDQEGKVIKSYSGVSDTPYDEIIEHVKILQ